jgi:hypothetical protein
MSKIDKVTAKTIFEDNVFYMITWKDKTDGENTWKPSEYFEQNSFLSSLVDNFEEEMKKTEENLFKKLEKEEKRRRLKKEREMDQIKVEDEGRELVWFGSGDERQNLDIQRKAHIQEVKDMAINQKMQFTHEHQMKLFQKYNPQLLENNKQLKNQKQTQITRNIYIQEEKQGGFANKIQEETPSNGIPNKFNNAQQNEIDIIAEQMKILKNIPNQSERNGYSVREKKRSQDRQNFRKQKLAVFYELELREKVFDYKSYGAKVLADLHKFSDPGRSKKLMSIRHSALFQKIPIKD